MKISGTGRPTGVRDDTVGAEKVATILYLEICACPFIVERDTLYEKVIVCVAAGRLKRLVAKRQSFSYQVTERGGLRVRYDEIDFRIFCDVGDCCFAANQDDEGVGEAFSGGADGLP